MDTGTAGNTILGLSIGFPVIQTDGQLLVELVCTCRIGPAAIIAETALLERNRDVRRQLLGLQWSLGSLFFTTTVVAIDLVAIISPSAVVVTTNVVGSGVVLALILRFRSGFNKCVTALIAFAVSLTHYSGLVACQSVYLLTFFPDRAAHSFGLGHPVAAAIVGAVLGIPLALVSLVISFLLAYAVVPRQANSLVPFIERIDADGSSQ